MQEENYMLFETYLCGNMSKSHSVDFENKLKTDASFNKAFKLYKETHSFLSHKFNTEEKQEAFKANLEHVSQAYFNNANPNVGHLKTKRYFKYAIAACAIVLLGFFVFKPFSTPIYNDYAQYTTISLTARGDNQALLQTAETAFNNKKFAKANSAFKSLLVLDNTNDELKFYYALCNIELDNFNTADALLDTIQKGTSVFKHKASWYLALSKLKQDDIEACIAILQVIPQDAEDYKQAQKLLSKLN